MASLGPNELSWKTLRMCFTWQIMYSCSVKNWDNFAMPDAGEYWLGKQLHFLCPPDLWNFPGTALLKTFVSELSYLCCCYYWCWVQNEKHLSEWTALSCKSGSSVGLLLYSFPPIYMYGTWLEHHCARRYDDVIKWKHFLHYWPFVRGIHWSPVDSPHKDQWSGALMFASIYAWTNDWANNRDTGDLRCHHAHYDTTVMMLHHLTWPPAVTVLIINSSSPGQNGQHFTDDIFKMHFHEWKDFYFE